MYKFSQGLFMNTMEKFTKIKDSYFCYKKSVINLHNQYWVQRISEVSQTKQFVFHLLLLCDSCHEMYVTKTDQQCVRYYRSKVSLYRHSRTLPPVSFSELELMSFLRVATAYHSGFPQGALRASPQGSLFTAIH